MPKKTKPHKTLNAHQALKAKAPPQEADWAGYENDPAARYFYTHFFGKSIEALVPHFAHGLSIERADELLFSPRRVFQYYIHAFVAYLFSPEATGDSDAASSFLSLLTAREKRDAGSVSGQYTQLAPCIDFVATHQAYFDASPDIYGDFQVAAQALKNLCADA